MGDLDITLIEAAEYSIIEFEIYLSEYPEDSTFIFTAWAIYLLENNCLNERGKDNFFHRGNEKMLSNKLIWIE